jgi:tetratricopeptide (TPR) repeat protein
MTLEEALRLRKQGELEQARALLLQLAQAHPQDAQIQYECGGIHDALGYEANAVPYYRKAMALGLPPEDLRGAYTCLGSTLRTLGRYEEALEVLQEGKERFAQAREIDPFLAMALYNAGRPHEAMRLLLNTLLDTTGDASIRAYERALRFYAQDIEKTWP